MQKSSFFSPRQFHPQSHSAVKDLDESFAKLDVESRVDDRVDCAVEVSQPGDGAVQRGGDTAAPAVGLQDMGEEERQPADDEHTLETGRGHGSCVCSTYVCETNYTASNDDTPHYCLYSKIEFVRTHYCILLLLYVHSSSTSYLTTGCNQTLTGSSASLLCWLKLLSI